MLYTKGSSIYSEIELSGVTGTDGCEKNTPLQSVVG